MEKFLPGVFFLLLMMFFLYVWFRANVDDWKQRADCTEQITGVLKKKYVSIKGYRHIHIRFNCMFHYTYHGREYDSLAIDEPSKKVYDAYEEGEDYCIYVNPQKPENIRCWSVEPKYHFLLDALRGLLFIISIPCTVGPVMTNVGKSVSWTAWVLPAASAFVFVWCIVSVNTDKKRK